MRYIILLLISFLSLNLQINAAEFFEIKGRVLDETADPIKNVEVRIGKFLSKTSATGNFSLKINENDIYQLNFSKDGYFSSIQSFSHNELTQTLNKTIDLFNIVLVNKAKNRVMLAFGGDVMMGRRYYKPYFGDEVLISPETKLADSKAIVQHIKPYMSLADYAAVNLETQIADAPPGERAPKSVTFYSEPETLAALTWAGVDYVSLGNNHTYDYMDSGLYSTMNFMSKSHLAYSGAGLNEEQALKAHHQKINNTPFSMLGFVGWEGSANPTQTANVDHGGAAFGSMKNMLNTVNREVNNDNVTIVQYHGSQEYGNNPTGVTEQRLKSSLDAGASLAIAHHPHVTQGLELYDGKLIAYSMGNFIFDQNFSATQHSFILYVWLDGDKFHRAEIVPLYVKGYKPTPATGMHRNTVMKRLAALSKQRNTNITQAGGHGVITANNASAKSNIQDIHLALSKGERAVALYQMPWHKSLTKVELNGIDNQYRLGTNLINGSDFESFNTFNAPERGWLFDREKTQVVPDNTGDHRLILALEKKQSSWFGMQSFKRVYTASQKMTIKGRFKTAKKVKVNFYWQGRKKRQKLFDAFENGTKHFIKSVQLDMTDDWRDIEVDLNSPRIGYKSYRVLVEFELLKGENSVIEIDDFALIEWQTAYRRASSPLLVNDNSKQATFIGFKDNTSSQVTLTYQ